MEIQPKSENRTPIPTGSELIHAERVRQIESEGYTEAHDDAHDCNELLAAAAVYMNCAATNPIGCDDAVWPWDSASLRHERGLEIKSLVKAGALIAAEIDRLQRAASVSNESSSATAEQ